MFHTAQRGANPTPVRAVGLSVVLEGFAGKAVAQAECLRPRPLLANGKCRAGEKNAKPDEKTGQKTELTVTKHRRPSRAAKTSAVLRTGDGK